MKELSIEQKAQRYDEAIKLARQLCAYPTTKPFISDLQDLFPELKESEDERIRKAIHIYLDWLDGRKDYAPRGEYTIRDMIAWLEKQATPQVRTGIEWVNTIDDAFASGDWDMVFRYVEKYIKK